MQITLLPLLLLATAAQAQPPAPAQLQASPGNGSVGLVWTAPADPTVAKYVVYINATPAAQVVSTETGFPPETAYLANSLTNGTAYLFAVSAVNTAGEEGLQSTALTAYPAVAPQAPASVSVTATTQPPQVQLLWTPVNAETFPLLGYTIYRSFDGLTGTNYAFATANTYTDAAVNTLNPYGGYYYQVAAVDQKGNTGPASSWVQALFPVTNAPAVPTGLSVTAQDGQVTLLWNVPTAGVDGYQVNLVKASDNSQTVFYTNTTPLAIPLPNTGDSYLASVAAITAGNLSPRTSVSFQTLPPLVTGLSIFSGNSYVQLSWTPLAAATGTTGYAVYGDASVSPATWLATVPVGQTTYNYPTASPFYYTVKAVNGAGASPQGQTVTAVAGSSSALPLPPQSLAANLTATRTLQISWTANPSLDSVTDYRLYALDGPFTGYWDVPVAAGANTTVANLTNGQSYRFFLTAVNVNGESATSLTLTAAPLAPPVNFTYQLQSNALLLSWNAGDTPSGVADYQLFSSTTGFTSMTFLTATAQTAYSVVEPLINGSYYFALSAVNALGQALPAGAYATVTATVNFPPAPPLPIVLTAGNAEIQILWHTVSNANSYNVYRTNVSGVYSHPLAANNTAKSTFLLDSGLTNTLQYFYTMTSVNDAGESTRSAEYSAIPFLPASLPADTAVRTSHVRRTISLAWDPSSAGSYPIVGYDIFRSQDGGASFRLLGGTGNPSTTLPVPAGNSSAALAYVDTEIAYGTTYEYRIQAIDFDSTHGLSHEGPAYLLARVEIDYPNNRLDIYCNAFNPAKGQTAPVALSEVQPGHTWVKVYNLAGELIRNLWEGNVGAQFNPDYPFLLSLAWDGKNDRGEIVASGVYLIHVEGQSRYHQSRKVAVIK
jgi:fibronectin type 3 domain-containing protein